MFRSVVVDLDNFESLIELRSLNNSLVTHSKECELVVVVSANNALIEQLTQDEIQNFVNTRFILIAGARSSKATTAWGGVDTAVGDRVLVIYERIPKTEAVVGLLSRNSNANALFAYATVGASKEGALTKLLTKGFNTVYKAYNKKQLASSQPVAADLDRKFVNFLQRSTRPEIALRNANIYQGFETESVQINLTLERNKKTLRESFARATEILFASSTAPLRAISAMSLLGAMLNLIYSIYVVAVSLLEQVARGWTSMSLQLSGMFLLISLVLAAMCEFLIFMHRSLNREPLYFIQSIWSSPTSGSMSQLNIATE